MCNPLDSGYEPSEIYRQDERISWEVPDERIMKLLSCLNAEFFTWFKVVISYASQINYTTKGCDYYEEEMNGCKEGKETIIT